MPGGKELCTFSWGQELGGKPRRAMNMSSSFAKAASPTAGNDGEGIANEVVHPFPLLSGTPFTLTWLAISISSSVASGILTMTIGLLAHGGAEEAAGASVIPTTIESFAEVRGTSTTIGSQAELPTRVGTAALALGMSMTMAACTELPGSLIMMGLLAGVPGWSTVIA